MRTRSKSGPGKPVVESRSTARPHSWIFRAPQPMWLQQTTKAPTDSTAVEMRVTKAKSSSNNCPDPWAYPKSRSTLGFCNQLYYIMFYHTIPYYTTLYYATGALESRNGWFSFLNPPNRSGCGRSAGHGLADLRRPTRNLWESKATRRWTRSILIQYSIVQYSII